MNHKTYWTEKGAPYGYYDEYVIFEVNEERFQMLDGEFDFLFHQLYHNYWERKECKYIQILKEWNELTGFRDLEEIPSTIQDNQDTIDAFALLKGVVDDTFPGIKQNDLEILKAFLLRNSANEIKIFKE